MEIPQKLPHHKTSIFTRMSRMAQQHEAINLAQGFPDFPTDPRLKELVCEAIEEGYNQYAPLPGVPKLRRSIAKKIRHLHGRQYDADREVLVTNGATQALFLAIAAFVCPGDEVVVLKPAYDSYEPAVKLQGGKVVPVQLKGNSYELDLEDIARHLSAKTRMLILNNPHNPSGNVLQKEELVGLASLLEQTDTLLLSDEVYEHIVFDNLVHYSASAIPGLAERSIVCASFGKTFHNTGWKIGYAVAPQQLMQEMYKLMEVNVFCVHHPSQQAFANYLKDPSHYLELGSFYQEKRDYFLQALRGTRFRFTPSRGSYFQLLDYSDISDEKDVDFAERLVREYGLATIPVSVFNKDGLDFKQLRLCFAKTSETLEQACTILRQIG